MKKLCIMLLISATLLCGCARSTFKDIEKKSNGSDEPFEYSLTVEGEVIEIVDNELDKYYVIAFEDNEKYKFKIPEYSLANNNKENGRDENGDYRVHLPKVKVGDRLKVECGEIQYFEGKNTIVGHTDLYVSEVK